MSEKRGWTNLFHRKSAELQEERLVREHLTIALPIANARQKVRGDGQISLSYSGTMAANLAPPNLTSIEAAGIESFIGPSLLNEPSKAERDACLADIPQIFRSRLFTTNPSLISGGNAGASIARALENQERWLHDVRQGSVTWCDALHRQWAISGVGPMLHIPWLPIAGSAALGRPPLEEFSARFPQVPIVGIAALDKKDRVRVRWPEFWAHYEDLLRGLILGDNAGDQRRFDFGIVQLLSALTAGTWLSEEPLGALNILGHVFPEEDPGRVAMISTEAKTFPVLQRTTCAKQLGSVWHTSGDVLRDVILRGIKDTVLNDSFQSLRMKKSKKGSVRALCANAPIEPECFLPIVREIEERIRPWLSKHDRNIVLQFASVGQRFDAVRQTGVVTFILLQQIDGSGEEVASYVSNTLSGPKYKLLGAGGNGHAPRGAQAVLPGRSKKGGK